MLDFFGNLGMYRRRLGCRLFGHIALVRTWYHTGHAVLKYCARCGEAFRGTAHDQPI
jgi:hypothetical protein